MDTVKMEQQAQSAKVASPRGAPRSRRRPRNEGRGVPAVSIVVPAKDEEENLPLLFEKFNEQMSRRRLRGEVILVDDGSTDGTYEVARAGAAQYRWLRGEAPCHQPWTDGCPENWIRRGT